MTDLRAKAERIKELAIEKTAELAMKAAGPDGGGIAYAFAHDQASEEFADVDQVFDDWLDLPDPSYLSSFASNLAGALPHLAAEAYVDDDSAASLGGGGSNVAITQIEPTGAFMSGWTSGTATSFAGFAGLFGPVVSNLWLCGNVLVNALYAEQAIWEEADRSLHEIADAAISTLEDIANKSAAEYTATLSVLAAVSGIIAVPFTAGGSLAAAYTFAAISGGIGLAGSFAPEDAEDHPGIDGGSPASVVSSVRDLLTRLNEHVTAKEGDVRSALSDTAGQFSAAMGEDNMVSPVVLPRPTVADSPSFGGRSGGA